jgi:hypothetical protein
MERADGHDPVAFAEKLRYWRRSGHNPLASKGDDFWHGPTVREQVDTMVNDAKLNGWADSLEYKGRATLV